MLNGKDYDNSFNIRVNKKDIQWNFFFNEIFLNAIPSLQMTQYFPKPSRNFGGNINVKVDFSNYTTKTDLKNVTHVDTSSDALKTNLACLKTKVDKLDIDKLVPVSVHLSKLSDVVKNYVVKKAVYDKLAAKVNNIDTSSFVLKAKYQTDKAELEKEFLIWVILLKTKTFWTRKQNSRRY